MGKRLRQHEQTEVRKNSVYVCVVVGSGGGEGGEGACKIKN